MGVNKKVYWETTHTWESLSSEMQILLREIQSAQDNAMFPNELIDKVWNKMIQEDIQN